MSANSELPHNMSGGQAGFAGDHLGLVEALSQLRQSERSYRWKRATFHAWVWRAGFRADFEATPGGNSPSVIAIGNLSG